MPFKGEIFLALRYLKPQKTLLCLLTYISLLGPMLGVAVLLVVMSVMNGMPKAFIEKLMNYNPHVTIELHQPGYADELVKSIEKKYKIKASPVTSLKVFVQKGQSIHPFQAKGVYPLNYHKPMYITDAIGRPITTSLKELLHTRDKSDYCLMSASTRGQYRVGDKLILHSPAKYKQAIKNKVDGKFKRINMNAAKAFTIVGFYNINEKRIDEQLIFINQDTANEMLSFHWGTATEIEITLDDPQQTALLIGKLTADPELKGNKFIPWKDKSKGIYHRIIKEKRQMTFVLFLIMGAAGLGISACIFSLVVQKTKEIGVLKSIGTNPLSIVVIFISQGAFIGVMGSFLGYLAGLAVLTYRTDIMSILTKFGINMGNLHRLPMVLDPNDVQLIVWGAIGICLLAATIPAIIAASVNPVKALQGGN